MKIAFYCQHVWGVGHLFRSLEICRALGPDQVFLISGGPGVMVDMPSNVTMIRLPGIMTDIGSGALLPCDRRMDLDEVKESRIRLLFESMERIRPDALFVELYPFGRRAFKFELDPLLESVKGRIPVFCSVRDILVEKKKKDAYEKWVIKRLNRFFDRLYIHSDPGFIRLDLTFDSLDRVTIPVIYTGFVAPPMPGRNRPLKERLGLDPGKKLLVASAGGGRSGADLLKSLARAINLVGDDLVSFIFTGPYISDMDFEFIRRTAKKAVVRKFATDFLDYLAACDLSVSMAGYNTCMNVLKARVPALIKPFDGDREQQIRAKKLSAADGIRVLGKDDLSPFRFSSLIAKSLKEPKRSRSRIDLFGAKKTADDVRAVINKGGTGDGG